MSIKLMSLIWSDHTGNLSSIEKSVLLRMADFAADDGSSIYPGYTRISKDTSLSYESVKKAVWSLTEKGYVVKVKKENPKTNKSAVFQINVNKLIPHPPMVPQTIPYGPTDHTPMVPQTTQPSYNHHITIKTPNPLKRGMSYSKKPKQVLEEEFEEVWKEWPLKRSKEASKRAYVKSRQSTTKEHITNAIRAYKREIEALSEKRKNDKKVFVPSYAHLSTWLNGCRWNDEYSLAKESSKREDVYKIENLPWLRKQIGKNPYIILSEVERLEKEAKEKGIKI